MSESKIQWTDVTWNPTTGCTRVSTGCDECYAVGMTRRLAGMGKKKYQGLVGKGKGHFNGVVKCHEDALKIPLRWRKPRMVFVNSMSDLFHKDVPLEFIVKVRAMMALTPRHTYQVLTKRPERMAEIDSLEDMPAMIYQQVSRWLDHEDGNPLGSGTLWDSAHKMAEWRGQGGRWVYPLPNEWKGTSVEDQPSADLRVSWILRCPAAVRFLSCEPLLGPVALDDEIGLIDQDAEDRYALVSGGDVAIHRQTAPFTQIDWVIVGGESGPGARPCDIGWIRSIRDQCKAAGVPCFVKQLGAHPLHTVVYPPIPGARRNPRTVLERLKLKDSKGGDPSEWPDDLRVREWPAVATAEVL